MKQLNHELIYYVMRICHDIPLSSLKGFPGGSGSKEPSCNARDRGSIPGSGRSPGEGNGNPLQCSCLENSMDRGAWLATVHGVEKGRTRVSEQHFHFLSPCPSRCSENALCDMCGRVTAPPGSLGSEAQMFPVSFC